MTRSKGVRPPDRNEQMLALMVAPASVYKLMAAMRVSRRTCIVHLRELRDAKRAHVSGWERLDNGRLMALYLAGPGKDVKRPRRTTAAERSLAYRQRQLALEPERALARINSMRAVRLKPRRDAMITAFYGAPTS